MPRTIRDVCDGTEATCELALRLAAVMCAKPVAFRYDGLCDELDDKFFLTYFPLVSVYQLKGNYSESVEMRARVAEINGNVEKAASIRESFAKGGWEGYLRYEISLVKPRPDSEERFRGVSYDLAELYVQLGEKDKAFEALKMPTKIARGRCWGSR